jgi:hypothetical protein
MKTIVILIFVFFSFEGFSQGLAVDLGYDNRIQDLRNNQKRLEEAYNTRYTKLKQNYNESIALNNASVTTKTEPTIGTYFVIATNGWDFMDKRKVFVENGVVTKYYGSDGNEILITQGGKISNFRTIIKLSSNLTCELIFLTLLEN